MEVSLHLKIGQRRIGVEKVIHNVISYLLKRDLPPDQVVAHGK